MYVDPELGGLYSNTQKMTEFGLGTNRTIGTNKDLGNHLF